MLKNNSKVVGEKLLLLEDDLLPARNEIHDVKKETRVFNKKSLLVKDDLNKIKKEAQALKKRLLLSKN